jgi:hypothetical protein
MAIHLTGRELSYQWEDSATTHRFTQPREVPTVQLLFPHPLSPLNLGTELVPIGLDQYVLVHFGVVSEVYL